MSHLINRLPGYGGYKSRKGWAVSKPQSHAGEPCKPGWSAARTGCTPASGRKPGKPTKPDEGKPGAGGEASETNPTVDAVHAAIEEFRKDPSKITSNTPKELASILNKLTVKELIDLKRRLGVKASGAKADLSNKIATRGLEAAKDKGGKEGVGGKEGAEEGKPRKEKPTVESVYSRISGIVKTGAACVGECLTGVASQLSDLTVKGLDALKKKLGIKASGIKAELVRKITERALEGAKPPSAKFTGKDKIGRCWREGKLVPCDQIGETEEGVPERAEPEPQEEPERVPETTEGTEGGAGGEPAPVRPEEPGTEVAPEAARPDSEERDRSREDESKSANKRAARRVSANGKRVINKINRYVDILRKKGVHHPADWLERLRSHIEAVGVDAALASLGEEGGDGNGALSQYIGASEARGEFRGGDFAVAYLDRHGIQMLHEEQEPAEGARAVSMLPGEGGGAGSIGGGDEGFKPAQPIYGNKLEEAKLLPGLETSEDISEVVGHKVTHLTPAVMEILDGKYGKGKWIVKSYSEKAAAGYGIYFPQRAARMAEQARNTIWTAGEKLAKYGFTLERNQDNDIIGIKHRGGKTYEYGSDEYNRVIKGDARYWADEAAKASLNEHGVELPEGGNQFMVQPAFPVVGVSEEQRAMGTTIAPGEGRVHIVTRDGKAELIKHSTWIKGEWFPVVFEDEQTKAMAQAAVDAINAMPEEARQGQVYAPDVLLTEEGYKVVEANASRWKKGQGRFSGSGYLRRNPFIIDSYVSHLTDREPAHVKFIRNLLTSRSRPPEPGFTGKDPSGHCWQDGKMVPCEGEERGDHEEDTSSVGGRSGPKGRISGPTGLPGVDARAKARIDPTQPESGTGPKTIEAILRHFGVGELKATQAGVGVESWQDQTEDTRKRYNARVLEAARRAGMLISPEKFERVTQYPNVGGTEHDVHEDADNNRFFKFTKTGQYGKNKDLLQYLDRLRLTNMLFPDLKIKIHGIVQSPANGEPQVVSSIERIEGEHPKDNEVAKWFEDRGWQAGDQAGSYKDPISGTEIRDAWGDNFIKTKDGMIPIDVNIFAGKAGPMSLLPKKVIPRRQKNPLPYKVNGLDDLSEQMQFNVTNGLATLPDSVHSLLARTGIGVNVGETLSYIDPDLEDESPDGWPEGTSWNMVPGRFDPNHMGVMVATDYMTMEGRKIRNSRMSSILRHETGHGVDWALGNGDDYWSSSPEFTDAWKKDSEAHKETEGFGMAGGGGIGYFTQEASGKTEVFAEVFAQLHGGGADKILQIMDAFPTCTEIVKRRLAELEGSHKVESEKVGVGVA